MDKAKPGILFLFLLLICFSGNAQNFQYQEKVYSSNIETVLLYKSGKINSFPILEINDPGQSLTLAFDDLDGDYKSYAYRIIHCNVDWTPSDIFENDYFDGQSFDYINHYEFSSNTYVSYTNYWLVFPAENNWFRLSGNYIIEVYVDEEEKKTVLTRRFYVTDQQVGITANVKEATYARFKNYKQELDFEILYGGVDVLNPMTDFKVVLRQNARWDNQITGLEPMYVQNSTLIYDYESENLFNGCSEWRYSDYRQLKFPGYGIRKIELDTIFYMYMLPEEDRSYLAYAEWKDINGNRVIAGESRDLKMSEVDYVMAFFRLSTPYPKDEEVYIFGALSDWQIQEKFKMKYNQSIEAYV
nr:DUF5103 domain-containing protein [Bacteroidota bacterium]